MGARCIIGMKKIHCTYPWLLVVGGQVQGNRLCVRDEGCCSTGSVMWCMGGVNGQLVIHNCIAPTKHGTYVTLPNTNYIFSSLQHCTPYAVITQVLSRDPDDGHISARNMLSRL